MGEHSKNIVYQGVHMVYNAQVDINQSYLCADNYLFFSVIFNFIILSPGSTIWRSIHSNGQRSIRVRVRVTAASPIHDLRQEAALYRSVPVQR